MRSIVAWLAGVFCAMYLMNPTGGVHELIPDRLSLVGNLDELMACLIFFSSLRHFGVRVLRFFRSEGAKGTSNVQLPTSNEKPTTNIQ